MMLPFQNSQSTILKNRFNLLPVKNISSSWQKQSFLKKILKIRKYLTPLIILAVLLIFSYIFLPKISLHNPITITEGIVGQPHFLNPLYADLNPVDKEITSLIFRGLLKFDQNNELIPDLAQSWELSTDEKTYTFKLKNWQLWHDKKEISTDDVEFTYKTTQADDYSGPLKNNFKNVQIEKIDKYIIKFTLKEPFAPFLSTLTLGILPKHLLGNLPIADLSKHAFNLKPTGSGIARFKSINFNKDGKVVSLVLSLSPDTQISIKQLKFKFFKTEDDLFTAFKLGEIDSFTTTSPSIAEEVTAWPNQTTYQKTIWGNYFALFFNLDNPKLKDINTRKALAISISKDIGGQPIDGPIPKISWAYFNDFEKYPYDSAAAKNLLNNLLNISLSYAKRPINEKIAQVIFDSWKQVGVQTDLKIYDSKELTEVIKERNFEVLLMEQELPHDPDVYTFWHSTQKQPLGLNITSLSNRRVDKALEDGRKKLKIEDRKEAYKDFQVHLADEIPAIFLFQPDLYYVVSKKVKNLTLPENLWHKLNRFDRVGEWEIK